METKQITDFKLIIQEPLLTLSSSTNLVEAVLKMNSVRTSYILAIEQEQLLGIFTERDLVRLIAKQTELDRLSLAEVMTKKLITITEEELKDIFQISNLLKQNKIRHLPVFNRQKKLIGVITPQSINQAMKPEYLLRYIKVSEAMVTNVITSFPDDSVLNLIKKMVAYRVSCVVIIQKQIMIPIGIITERDFTQFQTLNLNFKTTPAIKVMSSPLETVKPNDSLWNVYKKMQQMKVRRLVVVDDREELAGIVTQTQMLKLLNPAEIYQVIEQMQLVIEEQTQQLQHLNQQLTSSNEKLLELSIIDELTQVMNRRRFNQYLEQQWQRLKIAKKPLSLIICDVDDFKAYNDNYGHLMGDRCLRQIAQVLQQSVRQTIDLVARYGGEEFAIILPDCNLIGAKRVASEIMQEVETIKIPHEGSRTTGYITLSLGVANTVPNDQSSPEELIEAADNMLYESKKQGRNTYRLDQV